VHALIIIALYISESVLIISVIIEQLLALTVRLILLIVILLIVLQETGFETIVR
jgi:hypothetical protein